MRSPATIPHIPELPLVGSFFAFRDQRLALLVRVGAICGDSGRFSVGPYPIIFLNSAIARPSPKGGMSGWCAAPPLPATPTPQAV